MKIAGDIGMTFLWELITSVMNHCKIEHNWEMSFILSMYKGHGDTLNMDNNRGLKRAEHVMKVV